MNEKTNPVKKFWADHKTKIVVTIVVALTAATVVQRFAINQHNDFLKDKNLFDEFYAMDEV